MEDDVNGPHVGAGAALPGFPKPAKDIFSTEVDAEMQAPEECAWVLPRGEGAFFMCWSTRVVSVKESCTP